METNNPTASTRKEAAKQKSASKVGLSLPSNNAYSELNKIVAHQKLLSQQSQTTKNKETNQFHFDFDHRQAFKKGSGEGVFPSIPRSARNSEPALTFNQYFFPKVNNLGNGINNSEKKKKAQQRLESSEEFPRSILKWHKDTFSQDNIQRQHSPSLSIQSSALSISQNQGPQQQIQPNLARVKQVTISQLASKKISEFKQQLNQQNIRNQMSLSPTPTLTGLPYLNNQFNEQNDKPRKLSLPKLDIGKINLAQIKTHTDTDLPLHEQILPATDRTHKVRFIKKKNEQHKQLYSTVERQKKEIRDQEKRIERVQLPECEDDGLSFSFQKKTKSIPVLKLDGIKNDLTFGEPIYLTSKQNPNQEIQNSMKSNGKNLAHHDSRSTTADTNFASSQQQFQHGLHGDSRAETTEESELPQEQPKKIRPVKKISIALPKKVTFKKTSVISTERNLPKVFWVSPKEMTRNINSNSPQCLSERGQSPQSDTLMSLIHPKLTNTTSQDMKNMPSFYFGGASSQRNREGQLKKFKF